MTRSWGILTVVLCACTGTLDGGTADDDGGDDDPGPGTGDPPPTANGAYFSESMFFDQVATNLPKAANSASMLASVKSAGGWGTGAIQIDFTIDVLTAGSSAEMKSFEPTDNFWAPDCDLVPVPIPAGGNVENEDGYECTSGGDCHLIVHQPSTNKLYEMLGASISGARFDGGCLVVWDTATTYSDTLRGDQCTSADAAGFPIAPLLFTADEVAAGEINHAIRFILPNNRVKRGFMRPATHGSDTTGGSDAPPYGMHLRLRADYPIDSLPTEGAKVVARAMQTYGMYHADGGNIALTAQSDRHTTAKWEDHLGPFDLDALAIDDFEVLDHGGMIPLTYDCVR
ncbi:MAG: hypothetical protein H0V17_29555 [Deltaproteobacteria bacterium]|nr:hypothetical protein [Deltaproteobacteria bacterium]